MQAQADKKMIIFVILAPLFFNANASGNAAYKGPVGNAPKNIGFFSRFRQITQYIEWPKSPDEYFSSSHICEEF